jgi:hypothetical protein
MTRGELLRIVRAERGQWEQLLALAPLDQAEQPLRPGSWSLRDLLAHLHWYEQAGLCLCREGATPHPELWRLSPAERNMAILTAARRVSMAQVMAAWRRLFDDLCAWLHAADAATLAGTVVVPGGRARPRWRIVREYSYDHYRGHVDELRTWLE